MKWIAFIAGGVVALIAGIAILGAMLPRTHVASRSLTLRRTPEEIWPVVIGIAGGSSVPADIIESDPPRKQVSRVTAAEKNFGGTWTITIAPGDLSSPERTSVLTITEDGWVANPLFRFMSRYVMGHHATMDGILRQVAKKFNEEPALSGE